MELKVCLHFCGCKIQSVSLYSSEYDNCCCTVTGCDCCSDKIFATQQHGEHQTWYVHLRSLRACNVRILSYRELPVQEIFPVGPDHVPKFVLNFKTDC